MDKKHIAIEAIKKKLIGKTLSYAEIYAIMDEIAHARLGPVLTTYFTAAAFKEGFSDEELFYLTHAMVETGPKLSFDGIVADKHSIGGVAGGRTSMVIVPIIAAAGFIIPKNSSRAITTPSGTADAMEVLSPVRFTATQVKSLIEKVGGCIVWSGELGLAPADDVIISVTEEIAFESYDKTIAAIFAKKIATGATHVIFDVPVGQYMKVHKMEDARLIERKLLFLAQQFRIKALVDVNEMHQSAGYGVGPLLEARDALQVLEQTTDRPLSLEKKSLTMAGKLLTLCLSDTPRKEEDGHKLAQELLTSGKALQKMKDIIVAQGGNPDIASSNLHPGEAHYDITATNKGMVAAVNNQELTAVARILGCPHDHAAGIYLHKKTGDTLNTGDILCTLYSSDRWLLKEAMETIRYAPIYRITNI